MRPEPPSAAAARPVPSSANRPIIELVLDRAGLTGCFRATVSSEEVARGKPAPDVYLEAARRGGHVGGGHPQPRFPPPLEAVQAADLVVPTLRELTSAVITALPGG
jgi:beta-phosphoglucomutase-like phosphatase (HAD superfamily)